MQKKSICGGAQEKRNPKRLGADPRSYVVSIHTRLLLFAGNGRFCRRKEAAKSFYLTWT